MISKEMILQKFDYVLLSNGGGWLKFSGMFEFDANPEDLLDELWNDDSYFSGKDYCSDYEYSVVRPGDKHYENADFRVLRLPGVDIYDRNKHPRLESLKGVCGFHEMEYRLHKEPFGYDKELEDGAGGEAVTGRETAEAIQ